VGLLDVTVLSDTFGVTLGARGLSLVVFGFTEVFMRGSPKRGHVNKRRGAGRFRHQVSHTKGANIVAAPMRGGWRL